MDQSLFVNSSDPDVIEDLYQKYKQNPSSVDASWQAFFKGFEFSSAHYPILPKTSSGMVSDEFNVIRLIDAYRERGHLFAKINPILTRKNHHPNLDIEHYGFSKEHLNKNFEAATEIGLPKTTLQNIVTHLQETYCSSIGVEYAYIRVPEIRLWLRSKMEKSKNTPNFPNDRKLNLYKSLAEAVYFEKFIHKKFPGQKRFSLEGNDSLIPGLYTLINKGAELNVREFFIGMAHRGRLTVLANIMKKPISDIFSEFKGNEYENTYLLGDVKYHLGQTSVFKTESSTDVSLTLAPNPSHLEAVDTVVQGISRSKIDSKYEGDSNKVVPVVIHGDAALSGQGIVYESLQMSELPAYHTGGTIHIVTNNQIGFTTLYSDSRSSNYCTDVAKTIQAPIFHVNADDIEALSLIMELALEFRSTFHKDVFIDIVGYRRHGHNESDEPRFTQPVLYNSIDKHPNVLDIYSNKLFSEKTITLEEIKEIEQSIYEKLERCLSVSSNITKSNISSFLQEDWKHIKRSFEEIYKERTVTSIAKETLDDIAEKITNLPLEYKFFRKTKKLYFERKENYFEKGTVDWAMGELLAYASLVKEGMGVRLSGQDVERGTFSHRHAVITDEDGVKYYPLDQIKNENAAFEIYNSLLSEYGVLGFEYGHSISLPDSLTIWEAQFGDFANGAQIIIDQFISSGEEKWNVMSGLTLLLPHGFEGQGPEHSSGRMERFLIQCDESNMQVLNCTTPANFFHAIRRQLLRSFRKPLIVFTPKSLLRHPACISTVEDMTNGTFQEVIDDFEAIPEKIKRVIFTSGKIYYDLMDEKRILKSEDTAIVRLEQISPIPYDQLYEIVDKYHTAVEWIWAQEEPGNMGAWTYLHRNFKEVPLRLVARPDSSSPATGSSQLHKEQQRKLIDKAFGKCNCTRSKQECRMICSKRNY
ncbi:MAG: 2-oxoglutarate dehydrogenase E1 component [Bacteroidales bacterium]|nr:2-oxoglutarate dehydrogenase E1 component [Bacteroidales bacterium]